MSKIVFLLGAGASADALPTVKAFSKELLSIKNRIVDYNRKSDFELQITRCFNQKYGEFSLFDYERYFESIDSFAKYVCIADPEKYEDLKKIITLVFTFNQYRLKKIDKRYLSFITSIVDMNGHWPEHDISIVTWNYDRQFELAYKKLYSEFGNQNLDFFLVRLNEVADFELSTSIQTEGIYPGLEDGLNFELNNEQNNLSDNGHIKRISVLLNDLKSQIQYAWDPGLFQDTAVREAIDMLGDCQYLVSIGYSFPYFNRDIDRRLLETFRYNSIEGKRLIVQDVKGTADSIVEKLKSQFSFLASQQKPLVNMQPYEEVDSFYIPFET